jgi:hypothetical protein
MMGGSGSESGTLPLTQRSGSGRPTKITDPEHSEQLHVRTLLEPACTEALFKKSLKIENITKIPPHKETLF